MIIPDFLDEDGLEFASKVNGFDLAFKILPSKNLLLRVLDVMRLLRFDQPLHPARLHLPLQYRQGLV